VDPRNEIREFLVSRRSRLTPAEAGLPTLGHGRRRVPGLRREEVALLAGVSVDYYTRLERGNAGNVSEAVLEALSRALQLDDTEHAHLFDLVRSTQAVFPRQRRRPQSTIRPGVQLVLDRMAAVPAFVRNERLDLLAANALGRALYSAPLASPYQPANTARFVFLDPAAATFYLDWQGVARDVVAILRAAAGRDPHDRDLSDLVGELSTRSELFCTLWATHDVHRHDTGRKRLHHPLVGDLELAYESMQLVADPGLTMFVYTADPGSKSEQALDLLGSWSATPTEETSHADHEEHARHHAGAE
jgi:transcriptional regulator with XRE-family HTH domain